jgi:hypothetical protein
MKNIHLLFLTLMCIVTMTACLPFVGTFDIEVGTTPEETITLPPSGNDPTPTGEDSLILELASTPSLVSSTNTPSPSSSETPLQSSSEDAILILEPGPGSRITNPLMVSGFADSTFEQNLVIRIVLVDGTELALSPTTIQSELGQRGPFSAEISFSITGDQQAFIQVYSTSPRDGGITHLSSVGVTLSEFGPVDIRPVVDGSERIDIYTPSIGEAISGGIAHVEGFALASFEQTLIVEILDVDGNVIGSAPLIVAAPDIGMSGPFEIDVPYTLGVSSPGRVIVRDPSVAFNGDVHIASVEVKLEP